PTKTGTPGSAPLGRAWFFAPTQYILEVIYRRISMTAVAKLFKNGASQAVRLPKEFRFDGQEVCIKRVGTAVILFPRHAAWDVMEDVLGKFDDDF
ncbi:VapB, partial [mine drainage metagenome]